MSNTEQDELRKKLGAAFRQTSGIPIKQLASQGIEYHTQAGLEHFLDSVMQLYAAHKNQLLDRVEQEAPKDQDESSAGLSSFGIAVIRSNNLNNKQWRKAISKLREETK